MPKVSIKQVEPQVAEKVEPSLKAALKQVGYSVPDNLRLCVSLLRADGRKQRSNAGAETWAPQTGRMEFWLEPTDSHESVSSAPPMSDAEPSGIAEENTEDASHASTNLFIHPAEKQLLKALDRAESTPGWSFVSLKKFRDEILPMEDIPSVHSDADRSNLLRSAIEKRLILKKPIPNPKSPQFPVTSIRLNRLMPEVQRVLGRPKPDLDFHPIRIKGEPLSTTILRERR
jgi:hypothetical protein